MKSNKKRSWQLENFRAWIIVIFTRKKISSLNASSMLVLIQSAGTEGGNLSGE